MNKSTVINWLKDRHATSISSKNRKYDWVDSEYDDLRFTLVLSGIEDHFDASALWKENGVRQANIVNKLTQSKAERLEWVLHHCHQSQINQITNYGVFPHVLVWVPKDIWELAIRFDEKAINRLQTNLVKLHQDSFEIKHVEVRYQILHTEQLQYNEIAFQFGHSIYIASPDEESLGHVQIKSTNNHGLAQLINELPVSHDLRVPGNQNQNFYQGQEHLFILNPKHDRFIPDLSTWTLDECDYIHIKMMKGKWQAYNAITNPEISIQTREQSNVVSFEIQSSKSKQGMQPKLWVSLNSENSLFQEPVVKNEDQNDSIIHKPAATMHESTLFMDDQYNSDTTLVLGKSPFLQPALVLEGLVFPRIDTKAGHVPTLNSWRIYFNHDAELYMQHPLNDKQRVDLPAFIAFSDQDVLFYKAAYSEKLIPMHLPADVELGKHKVSVNEAIFLKEKFHGFMTFPTPTTYNLEKARNYRIGRKTPNNTQQLDIDLSFLNDQRSMDWDDQSPHFGHTLSSLVLSRLNLIATTNEDNKCHVSAQGSAPIYVLENNETQCQILNAQETNEYFLDLEQRFIVGGFLMRFCMRV